MSSQSHMSTSLLAPTLLAAAFLLQPAIARADAGSDASRCAALAGKLGLPGASITVTQPVSSGAFQPPVATSAPITGLPAFCRVVGVIEPQIGFEVWMPVDGWNGKLFGIGAGGLAGKLVYVTNSDALPGMADVLKRGFAAAATDTGHVQGLDPYDLSWLLGQPHQRTVFGYRAVHEMTVAAKEIIRAYYGEKPRHSYYAGCSGGGRQGLMEAQRYPADYDGVMAMAAANPIELMVWLQTLGTAIHKDPENRLSPDQLPTIRKAVLDRCDANDGVLDGLIEDPRRCDFDIGELQCESGASGSCLSPGQVGALKLLYEPVRNSAGAVLFPALPRGQDFSGQLMPHLVAGPRPWGLPDAFFRYWIYEDPAWDSRTFDAEAALPLVRQKGTPLLTATPDLREYHRAGGRLLLVHGWSDEGMPPQTSIDYYEKTIAAVFGEGRQVAKRAADFARLFMVPGMNHCRGGPGQTHFDTVSALDQWVTAGVIPERIVATHVDPASGVTDRSRPLCAYPKAAVYKGNGSIDDAENFRCGLLPQPSAPAKPVR